MNRPCAHLVDNDPSVLRALTRLFAAEDIDCDASVSAEDFLEHFDASQPGCVVLDLALPGVSGLKLQERLHDEHVSMPIVFLSGRGDVGISVRAMKDGAIDFLTKPVDADALLAAVRHGFELDLERRSHERERAEVERRLSTLTPRERDVLPCVLAGRLNKQIAADLGVVEKTVKVHRARMMQKLGVRSVQDLVRMIGHAGIELASGETAPRVGRTANSASR